MKRIIVLTAAVGLCLSLQARTIVVKDSVRAETMTTIVEGFDVADTYTSYSNTAPRVYEEQIGWQIVHGRICSADSKFGKDNNCVILVTNADKASAATCASLKSEKVYGVKKVTWFAAKKSSEIISQILYISNDGETWNTKKISGLALDTYVNTYTVEFDAPTDIYMRITCSGKVDERLYIDDIVIETYPWEYSSHEEEKWDFTKEVTKDSACIVCYDKAVEAGDFAGAEFYEIAYQTMDGIVVDEVKELEAGMPYVMLATDTQFGCDWTGDAVMQAGNHNGLYGTLTEITNSEELENMWIISGNELWQIGTDCQMGPNKGYINMSQVPTTETTLAPGRKRVTLSGSGNGVSTALPFRTIPNKIRCGLTMRSGRLMVCKEGNIYSLCGERIR